MIATTPLQTLLDDANGSALSLADLERWGRTVGAQLPRPAIITLHGELGAGKTTLARAICSGAGVFDVSSVTSPTFAILHEYAAADGPILHADLYRVRSDAELDALGWDEIVGTARVLIVEWPERASRAWPAGTITISLSYAQGDSNTRTLIVLQV